MGLVGGLSINAYPKNKLGMHKKCFWDTLGYMGDSVLLWRGNRGETDWGNGRAWVNMENVGH